MDDKEFWREYYAQYPKPTYESSFANFVLPHMDENKNMIELGCGNGRDSIYFAQNNINVIAVDQIQEEIDYLNENHGESNLKFIVDDFTNLSKTESDVIRSMDFDYVYSRFTFHSINEKKENRTLDWIECNLTKGGYFFLEARSLNDAMFKRGVALSENENFTDHYRRYLDLKTITEKLESRNFKIIHKSEGKNLAIYEDDNPCLIRIIAEKI